MNDKRLSPRNSLRSGYDSIVEISTMKNSALWELAAIDEITIRHHRPTPSELEFLGSAHGAIPASAGM